MSTVHFLFQPKNSSYVHKKLRASSSAPQPKATAASPVNDKLFRIKQLVVNLIASPQVVSAVEDDMVYHVPNADKPTEDKTLATDSHLLNPFLSTPHIFFDPDQIPPCKVSDAATQLITQPLLPLIPLLLNIHNIIISYFWSSPIILFTLFLNLISKVFQLYDLCICSRSIYSACFISYSSA